MLQVTGYRFGAFNSYVGLIPEVESFGISIVKKVSFEDII